MITKKEKKNQPFWVPTTAKGPIKHTAKDRVRMSHSYHCIYIRAISFQCTASGPPRKVAYGMEVFVFFNPKASYKLTYTSNLADKSSNLVPKFNIAVKKRVVKL